MRSINRILCGLLAMVAGTALQACGSSAADSRTDATASFERAYPKLTFDQPIALMRRPGDAMRWYVGEKSGRIRWFENSPNASTSTLALDIASRVVNPEKFDERGFLGFTFHPKFEQNGRVYVNYVTSGPERSRISEFTSTDGGDSFDPASERILIEVNQPASNHNGGHLEFGPDGYLYSGFGDGGAADDYYANGQRMSTVLGKMIRIDPDTRTGKAEYGIPGDNPFAGKSVCRRSGSGSATCPEIWASGMRNPWRWTFDRETGELWVGDVMQDNYEEINLITKGANYGWPIRQGKHCFPTGSTGCRTSGLTDPVAELLRDEGGASIIAGYVYRGNRAPKLRGRFIFTDAGSGIIGSVHRDAQGNFVRELLNTNADYTVSYVSFGEAADGEMYVVSLRNGSIHKLILGPAGNAGTKTGLIPTTPASG
jgi:glucose/arabinose dehydrogenase